MESGRVIRPARREEIPAIMAVLDAARGIMRASGNMLQWAGGYPSEAVVEADIAGGNGFVVADAGRVVGYFAFIPSPEPTYTRIYEGSWLDDTRQYYVIHRMGSFPDAHGIFKSVLDWAFDHTDNIRIDTHRDNHIMQHCITSYGFTYCGIIYLASGDDRLAYQKC